VRNNAIKFLVFVVSRKEGKVSLVKVWSRKEEKERGVGRGKGEAGKGEGLEQRVKECVDFGHWGGVMVWA